MPSKKQKHKGEQWRKAKSNIAVCLNYGLPKEEYLELAQKQGLDIEETSKLYDKGRQEYALDTDQIEYLGNVQKLMNKNKTHQYSVYFPLFDILEIVSKNDVVGVVVKSKFDWNYRVGEYNHQFLKGEKNILVGKELLEAFPLVITDMNDNKVLTKQTAFESVEKIVEKTKVITQEKKTGIDQKKLDKAISKTKHDMYKKWQPSAVDAVINSLINNL